MAIESMVCTVGRAATGYIGHFAAVDGDDPARRVGLVCVSCSTTPAHPPQVNAANCHVYLPTKTLSKFLQISGAL